MIIHHYNEDYLNGQDGVGDNDDQDDRGGYGNHNHAYCLVKQRKIVSNTMGIILNFLNSYLEQGKDYWSQ